MKWWHWLIVAVFVTGGILGILGIVGVFRATHEIVEYIESAQLTVVDSKMTYEQQGYPPEQWPVVTGHAKNTGTRELSYASVTVKWYDVEGAVIGTSSDFTTNLAVGEIWAFRCKAYIWSGIENPGLIVSYQAIVGAVI